MMIFVLQTLVVLRLHVNFKGFSDKMCTQSLINNVIDKSFAMGHLYVVVIVTKLHVICYQLEENCACY